MAHDRLTSKKYHSLTNTTDDRLTTPLAHLIGKPNLWGRLDAFLNIAEATDRSPNTILSYRAIIGDFIKFANAHEAVMPGDINEEHIVAYIIHKRKTCGGVSINTIFKHIRAWFNWMISRHIIESSPLANLKAPTLPKTVIKPLTEEQLQQLLDCCAKNIGGIRNKAIILLIYDSGLRRSEVSGIKLIDVDLKRNAIKVMGKGAKERYVAIGNLAKNTIMEYLYMRNDSLPWLFVTHKEKQENMKPENVYLNIKRIMRAAGITGVKTGPHTLRHSFATASIKNGANLFYVQSLLGHSTLTMTRRYAATVDSEEAIKHHHSFSPADKLNSNKRR
ncbi:MAG: tyrosine-type recombinase/integrase [Dehalococcoidia bacterium]|nr:tyrosine-type recombinase/integrase [Dehalococcoidia bacterium]